ncbi:MAG: hypothetical protein EPO28_04710 [Saprospiraceae bacterium]|nr:MAG: hypothetical protein EPO28_04710 [Saprospiraceae bacterium]
MTYDTASTKTHILFCARSLVTKPGATEFFSFITREYESDIEFEELSYAEMPESYQGKSIADLHIRKEIGANIIGFKQPNGGYVVNPGPEIKLVEKSSFIVLGNKEQLEKLRRYLKTLDWPTAFQTIQIHHAQRS